MEASQAEKNVFGADVKLHPVTRMPIEQGIGARSVDEQVLFHLAHIERQHGRHIADAMREKIAASKAMAHADADLKISHEEDHV